MKTLKDLGKGRVKDEDFNDTYFLVSELKQKAIKWVKEYQEEEIINMNAGRMTVGHYWKGKRVALMDFFNLTEEDLK